MKSGKLIVLTDLVLSGCIFGRNPEDPDVGFIPDSEMADSGPTDLGPPDAGTPDTGGPADAANPRGTSDVVDAGKPEDVGGQDVSIPENCGDRALQADEKCDPAIDDTTSSAYCPRSADDCDDGLACTRGRVEGSADNCSAVCAQVPIEACTDDDGCCPSSCDPETDNDCTAVDVCGDGQVTGPELCDPQATGADKCPVNRDDCAPIACMSAVVMGSDTMCNSVCQYNAITSCTNGDGCCAPGCDSTNDNDCSATCGNGIREIGETCDGNCPTACDDGDVCTMDTLQGDSTTCDAECVSVDITMCADGDGCCPDGCDASTDNDCSASCGDGIVDPNETCDQNCPTVCDDADGCTADRLIGSANSCTAECTFSQISACDPTPDGCCPAGCNANTDGDCVAECGNGVTEPGETCDGNCPAACFDGDACTVDTLTGDAATCTAFCSNDTITQCFDGDGCCPSGCNANTDDNCGAVCGNGITEPGETCDGDCGSITCNDGNACTTDLQQGTPGSCNVSCSSIIIDTCFDGDGCCPQDCNANNDSDCDAVCGNGVTEGAELCDGDCPTADDCGVCQTFSGGAANCDAQCVTISGCTPCDLNGTCTCAAGQHCENGVCTSGTGTNCDLACDSDAYCDAYNANGATYCVGTDCVECQRDDECEPAEWCDGGKCDFAPRCSEASDPDTWCVKLGPSGAEYCDLANGTCEVCLTDNQCAGTDICVANRCTPPCTKTGCTKGTDYCNVNSGRCEPAPNCEIAVDPSEWCLVNVGDKQICVDHDEKSTTVAVCRPECSPAGPDGACACPDPKNQTCDFRVAPAENREYSVCVAATACDQICKDSGLQDNWCQNQGAGNTCRDGACF